MIDTLVAFDEQISQSEIMEELGVDERPFVLMTIHRPATVDHEEGLVKMLELLEWLSRKISDSIPDSSEDKSKARVIRAVRSSEQDS